VTSACKKKLAACALLRVNQERGMQTGEEKSAEFAANYVDCAINSRQLSSKGFPRSVFLE